LKNRNLNKYIFFLFSLTIFLNDVYEFKISDVFKIGLIPTQYAITIFLIKNINFKLFKKNIIFINFRKKIIIFYILTYYVIYKGKVIIFKKI
jgi:hypothetical protein